MTDASPAQPFEAHPKFHILRRFARAELRTRALIDEAQEVIDQPGHTWETLLDWKGYAEALLKTLYQQEYATEEFAGSLGLESEFGNGPAEAVAAARLAEARPRAPRAAGVKSGTAHEAPCPVAACRTTVRHADSSTTHEPRMLPITPALADRPYHCPCDRHATLTVGRTASRTWVLREWTPSRDDREEINLIAHALVTGQAHKDKRYAGPVDTSPNVASARMVEAHATMTRLDRQVRVAILAGHLQRAFELAEQATAADHAYKIHRTSYARESRQLEEGGRWKNAEWFWISLGVPVAAVDGEAAQTDIQQRFLFHLVAVHNEATGNSVVVNAAEIESESGIDVGPDGWAELMAFLGRVDPNGKGGKPGQAPDLTELVYFDDRGTLTVRKHVKQRYPRALVALEALRRTLIPDRGKADAQARADTKVFLPERPRLLPEWASHISIDTAPNNPDNPD